MLLLHSPPRPHPVPLRTLAQGRLVLDARPDLPVDLHAQHPQPPWRPMRLCTICLLRDLLPVDSMVAPIPV